MVLVLVLIFGFSPVAAGQSFFLNPSYNYVKLKQLPLAA